MSEADPSQLILDPEGELQESSICKEYLQVRPEGGWKQNPRDSVIRKIQITAADRKEGEYERFAAHRRTELEAQGEANLLNLLDAEVKKLPKRKKGGEK